MVIKFGTDGWRAIMAEDFTFANVEVVVQAIANYIKGADIPGEGIVIGYDNRFLSPEFAQRAAEVLMGNGISVLISEQAMPTPVTAFAVVEEKAKGALMFTASHNPPTYNGIKFIPHYGGPALPAVTETIEEQVKQVREQSQCNALLYQEGVKQGLVKVINPKGSYLAHLMTLVDQEAIRKANLTVAVDPMFGAGVGYLDELLVSLGCQVQVINNYRDPLFGGKMPEPSAQVLEELAELVKQPQVQLGLALDGDADRFGIMDADSQYITPNQVLSLLFYSLLQKGLRGPVTKTVSTTQLLNRIAQDYQLETLETPVGFKYIGQNLMERGCIIGGEESGGLSITGHLPEKDGILACLLIVELIAVEKKGLSQLLQQLTDKYGTLVNERLDIHCTPAEKQRVLTFLTDWRPTALAGKTVVDYSTTDGLKIICADGSWVLIRPSGTEPMFRIYGETENWGELKDLQKEVRETLQI